MPIDSGPRLIEGTHGLPPIGGTGRVGPKRPDALLDRWSGEWMNQPCCDLEVVRPNGDVRWSALAGQKRMTGSTSMATTLT